MRFMKLFVQVTLECFDSNVSISDHDGSFDAILTSPLFVYFDNPSIFTFHVLTILASLIGSSYLCID